MSLSINLLNAQSLDNKAELSGIDVLIEKLDSLFENNVMVSPLDDDFLLQFEAAFPDMEDFQFKLDSLNIQDFNIDELLKQNQNWNFSNEDFESMMDFGMQMLEEMNADTLNKIIDQLNLQDIDLQFLEPFLNEIEKSDSLKRNEKHLKKI